MMDNEFRKKDNEDPNKWKSSAYLDVADDYFFRHIVIYLVF